VTISVRYGRLEAYRAPIPGQPAGPYVPVRLYNGGLSRDTLGLVDSGADVTLFNVGFAALLNVDLTGVPDERVGGVGGATLVKFVPLQLAVGGSRFSDRVGFTTGIGVQFGLLGRTGFFRACAVGFDERQARLLYHFLPPKP